MKKYCLEEVPGDLSWLWRLPKKNYPLINCTPSKLRLQAVTVNNWVINLARVQQKACGVLISDDKKNWFKTLTHVTIHNSTYISSNPQSKLRLYNPTTIMVSQFCAGYWSSTLTCMPVYWKWYCLILLLIFLFRFLLNSVGQQVNLPDSSLTKWIRQYHQPLLPHCLLSSSTLEAPSTSISEDQM